MTADELNQYQCRKIEKFISMQGKDILEIGCGNGDLLRMIAAEHSPNHITGIDLMLEEWWGIEPSEGPNWCVKDGDAEDLPFEDASFDAVVSFSTFEHIGNLQKALAEIRRVLKPYGRFYTQFMPIWTSVAGHHFVAPEETTWNMKHLEMIPPWGHLYMSEREMAALLSDHGADRKLIDDITDFIYHSKIINRKSRSDILHAMMTANMAVRHYSENITFNRESMLGAKAPASEWTADIASKVAQAGYNIQDMGVWGMSICLEKYANM